MIQAKKIISYFFRNLDRSRAGDRILGEINVLAQFKHYGEAAAMAKKALDNLDAPQPLSFFSRVTSTERKLIRGAYGTNLENAKKNRQEIPTLSAQNPNSLKH